MCDHHGGLAGVGAHTPSGTQRPAGDLHDRIDREAAAVEQQVIDWRHDIHRNPELSNREERTAKLIADHLESLGLDEVRTGIAGHGVVGVLRGGGGGERVVALRADIDALPVKEASGEDFASTVVDRDYPGGPFPVAHACGHDLHTAMLMGAASALASVRDELPGKVLFVFQPAEEGPPLDEDGGARLMQEQDALADPEPTMVFGMHVLPYPTGCVAYTAGNQYAASVVIRAMVTGEGVHGSTPWMGLDPMPAAAAIVTECGQLYRQIDAGEPFTVTIGHVEDRGRFNVIGDTVTLYGTIRAGVADDMKELQQRFERMAKGCAEAEGCEVEVEFLQYVPPVHNTQEWVDATVPTLERVVGHDRLLLSQTTLGYDDVSEFMDAYGGIYVILGCQDVEVRDGGLAPIEGGRGIVLNHNAAFYADDAALATGTRVHAHVALDHLNGELSPSRSAGS